MAPLEENEGLSPRERQQPLLRNLATNYSENNDENRDDTHIPTNFISSTETSMTSAGSSHGASVLIEEQRVVDERRRHYIRENAGDSGHDVSRRLLRDDEKPPYDDEIEQPEDHSADVQQWLNPPYQQTTFYNSRQESKYDSGDGTRLKCIGGVCLGGFLSSVCIAAGIYIICAYGDRLAAPVNLSSTGQEILSLSINIIVTFCLDGMMFVHSVSLRWALYNEKRLDFNTNLRLFTNAKRSGPNRWYVNIFALACLILCYAASSFLFMTDEADLRMEPYTVNGAKLYKSYETSRVNGVSLIALGLGIAGQTWVSTWCLWTYANVIPTWSSNPLNNALVALQNGLVHRRDGRCIMSVHQRREGHAERQYPVEKQQSILKLHRIVGFIIGLLWTLAVLAIVWTVIIALLSRKFGNDDVNAPHCWRFRFNWAAEYGICTWNTVTLSLSPAANVHSLKASSFNMATEAVLGLLFLCLIQAAQTIALHCAELLVNISRDEATWRHAYVGTNGKGPGTTLVTGAFEAAALSWENVLLFIAKALLHWSIGQGLRPAIALEDVGLRLPDNSEHATAKTGLQFEMVYSRLLLYAILAILLAVYVTYLSMRRRSGYQPATMGHLQTIVDLVDDWTTNTAGQLWWGDKNPTSQSNAGNEVRHAGTSWFQEALGPISATSAYAGHVSLPTQRRNF